MAGVWHDVYQFVQRCDECQTDLEGPFKIIEVKPPNVYLLKMRGGRKKQKVHVSELKEYREGRAKEEGGVGGGDTNQTGAIKF